LSFKFFPGRKPLIKFNSVLYYQCAASTARRPITDAAQEITK
jgi:hypothetical protein